MALRGFKIFMDFVVFEAPTKILSLKNVLFLLFLLMVGNYIVCVSFHTHRLTHVCANVPCCKLKRSYTV